MSDGITITAPDIFQLRYKLGIRIPEYSISLSGDPFKPTFYVRAKEASQTFLSSQQALHFLRSELLTHLRKAKNSRDKLRRSKKLRKAYKKARGKGKRAV